MRGDVDMDTVCTAAIKHWGVISQLLMVVEELSELQQAVCKFYRGKPHNVAEEIADVKIMLRQLEFITSCTDEVKEHIDFKLDRLCKQLGISGGIK